MDETIADGALDEPFWRALERGAVELPSCSACGTWIWPVRPRCPACHGPSVTWIEVEPYGTVFSWTRTWYPFVPERADDVPYVVVLAELPSAGGSRVLGVLDGDDASLRIGAAVRGVVVPASPMTLGLPSLRWRLDG